MKFSIGETSKLLRAAISPQCWYLIFSVTNLCNQRCRMCFNRDMDQPSDDILTLEEIKKIAMHFDGLFQLTLSGGEPLLRRDLPDIVRAFCSRRAVPRITLPSNGQLPDVLERITKQLLTENPGSNINVALSLDGVGERHDDIRGVRGAFEKFGESLERLSKLKTAYPNLTVVVASTISSFNQDYTDELLDFIGNSLEPQMYGMMMARGKTREEGATDIAKEQFLATLKKLHRLQSPHFSKTNRAWNDVYLRNRIDTIHHGRMTDPCKAGSKLLVLTYNGFVWPCEPLQSSTYEGEAPLEGGFCYGNLRDADYDVRRLLRGEHAEQIRKFIDEKRCACTFECALLNNFALNPANYIKAMKELFWSRTI